MIRRVFGREAAGLTVDRPALGPPASWWSISDVRLHD
jgi:hypothetical protein